MRYIILVLICSWGVQLSAQGRASSAVERIDSIRAALSKTKQTEQQLELRILLASEYANQNEIQSCKNQLNELDKLLSRGGVSQQTKALTYSSIGDQYYLISETPASIIYFNKALLVVNGLKADEKVNCYNKLGILYADVKEFKKSCAAYRKGIELIPPARKIKPEKYFEHLYNNIGLSYMELNQLDSAFYYHQKCLQIRMKLNKKLDLGQSYNNIGSIYFTQKQCDSSLFYFKKGLHYRSIAENRQESSIIESKINIAKSYLCLNNYKAAENLLTQAYLDSKKLLNSSLNYRALEQLVILKERTGDYKQSLAYSKEFYRLKDSMYALETREEVIRLNHAQIYAEKRQHDSLLNVQKELAEQMRLSKEQELRKQKEREANIILAFLLGAILLMGGIILLIYRNYKSKKRASELILEQKNEVELQRDIAQRERQIATEQKEIAEIQKNKIQKIHQEITDSIVYAKRIQSAILPQTKLVKSFLKESFILYKPKDIVAGDFYWFEVIDELIYFAAADCTGHGVPGAMVSVVCHNALNRSVKEFNLKNPHEILDKTREIVIAEFEKSDEDVKDGMDISLCVLDLKTLVLLWSGAHNPLWILRKGELLEIKADKQPIGKFTYAQDFTKHQVQLERGDEIYIFTDGFQDQFGGEKGKKFKASQLRSLLIDLQALSMEEKREAMDLAFEAWRGELEQVDDVCLIGVRF